MLNACSDRGNPRQARIRKGSDRSTNARTDASCGRWTRRKPRGWTEEKVDRNMSRHKHSIRPQKSSSAQRGTGRRFKGVCRNYAGDRDRL